MHLLSSLVLHVVLSSSGRTKPAAKGEELVGMTTADPSQANPWALVIETNRGFGNKHPNVKDSVHVTSRVKT